MRRLQDLPQRLRSPQHPGQRQSFIKQVHVIVPYGPGGTSDILARLIGPELSKAIGQPVIVENKPSASGNIGADYVAKQPGDGHTLLITDVGTLATQPSLVKKLAFDVQKDLVPVGMVMFSPYCFAVHPSLPVSTFAEMIAYDKANPGKLNVANSGVGSVQHLLAIVIAKSTGSNGAWCRTAAARPQSAPWCRTRAT